MMVAYDPVDELRQAASRPGWLEGPNPWAAFWVDASVDLVIRSGGGPTLSEFVPLQAGYARLVFLETLFNDTTLEQFERLVHSYEATDLLYGE